MKASSIILWTVLVLAVIFSAPAAHAQADNDISDPFCDATVSGSDCMSGWDSKGTTTGGGTKEVKCPSATNYDSCVKNCDCEFNKAKAKCGTSPTCVDFASAEHNACLGKCITDYT